MKISRRNFLGALSASAAVVFPLAGSALSASKAGLLAPSDALAQLGWSSFYPYINTEFEFAYTIAGGRKPRTGLAGLTLSAMSQDESLRSISGGRDPRSFVLTFKGAPNSRLLTQDTYPVEHFALGRFDLFISDGSIVNNEYIYTCLLYTSPSPRDS